MALGAVATFRALGDLLGGCGGGCLLGDGAFLALWSLDVVGDGQDELQKIAHVRHNNRVFLTFHHTLLVDRPATGCQLVGARELQPKDHLTDAPHPAGEEEGGVLVQLQTKGKRSITLPVHMLGKS